MKPSITGKLGRAFNIFINMLKSCNILDILVSSYPHILIIPYPSSYPQVSCNCSWTESENALIKTLLNTKSLLKALQLHNYTISLCTVRQQLCNAMEDLLNGTNYAMQCNAMYCTVHGTDYAMQCIAKALLYRINYAMQCMAKDA